MPERFLFPADAKPFSKPQWPGFGKAATDELD
jgi:hypothetical protein